MTIQIRNYLLVLHVIAQKANFSDAFAVNFQKCDITIIHHMTVVGLITRSKLIKLIENFMVDHFVEIHCL